MYGMYMTRITTANYGTWLFHLVIVNILMTLALTAFYKTANYLVIFVSSGVLLSLLEYAMVKRGARTSRMFVYGHHVSPLADSFVKGMAEGPSLCVPALYAADMFYAGQYVLGIVLPCLFLLLWSGYWALAERRGLKALKPDEQPIINRRWMTKPEALFVLGLINLAVAISVFRMEPANQMHAVYFMVMFFVILQVFFLVHSYFGIRRIDKYDAETKVFAPAGRRFSMIGYTFDSIFEMAVLNMPYYLIPYALGLITISHA